MSVENGQEQIVSGHGAGWEHARPSSVSASTQTQYRHRFALLKRRFAKESGYELTNEEFVNRLISLKSELAMRSWRLYKAATMFVLRENSGANIDAIEVLAAVSSRGMPRESDRGSGKKLKRVPGDVAQKLVFMLKSADPLAGRTRKYSGEACNFLLATIETGLRPAEWATAKLVSVDDVITLVVNNGKYNSIRANGPTRELHLDKLSQDKLDVIQNTIECVTSNINNLPNYFRELNREIKRGMQDLIRNGHIHYRYRNVSLYSARHQFTADAKSANLPYREVAALLGHKSQKTASWHYARKTSGKGSVSIRPSDASIARVSQHSPTHPSPTLSSDRNSK